MLLSRHAWAARSTSQLKHQAAAAPGMVVISRATRSLVKRGFTTEVLGPVVTAGRRRDGLSGTAFAR